MSKFLVIIITGLMFFNSKAQEKAVISVEDMNKKLTDTSFIILDVRTPQELEGSLGKIDGVINIPLQQLEGRLHQLQPYKDKEIAVICRSGNRSQTATEILRKNGFIARNVKGGMIEYRRKIQ
ncbi:MAG: rhodanese-like domain-containing protein [Ignavibacteriales bacterium]|nr:MAG: rhodanese-like domain-containing protein [Ignavibacteriales bacterium]